VETVNQALRTKMLFYETLCVKVLMVVVLFAVHFAVLNSSQYVDRYLKFMQFNRRSDILLVISCYKLRM